MELNIKWNYYVKCKQETKSHKKMRNEIFIHMDHEPSPLSNTKMPKAKPITKLMDTYLRSSLCREPPTTN
jgi:hypothetical protein